MQEQCYSQVLSAANKDHQGLQVWEAPEANK